VFRILLPEDYRGEGEEVFVPVQSFTLWINIPFGKITGSRAHAREPVNKMLGR